MVILVKNHKKRDESIRLRRENARTLLKEKQAQSQVEAARRRNNRMKGIPLPEDIEIDEKIKA